MARKLFSDEEIMRLRKLFQEGDTDGSGALSPEEANVCLKKFGIAVTDEQVTAIMKKVDSNASGSIEFVEFIKFATCAKEVVIAEEAEKKKAKPREVNPETTVVSHVVLTEKQIAHITALFKKFDVDGSGSVSAKEVQKILENFGIKLKPNQVNALVKLVDDDDSGEISLEEFIELVRLALNPEFLKKKQADIAAKKAASEAAAKSRSFGAGSRKKKAVIKVLKGFLKEEEIKRPYVVLSLIDFKGEDLGDAEASKVLITVSESKGGASIGETTLELKPYRDNKQTVTLTVGQGKIVLEVELKTK